MEANHQNEPLVSTPLLFGRSHELEASTRGSPAKTVRIAREKKIIGPGRETAFIFYSGRDPEELGLLVEETGALGAIDKAS